MNDQAILALAEKLGVAVEELWRVAQLGHMTPMYEVAVGLVCGTLALIYAVWAFKHEDELEEFQLVLGMILGGAGLVGVVIALTQVPVAIVAADSPEFYALRLLLGK